ncbi:hypothetical protein D3C85_1068480 [compost metagenome]
MAADQPAVGRGNFFAKYPAHPYRFYSAAGTTVAVCADPPANRPAPGGVRHDLRPDHALHVPAGGFCQYLPQRDLAGQREQEWRGCQWGEHHPGDGDSGGGHGIRPVGRGIHQLSQETRV